MPALHAPKYISTWPVGRIHMPTPRHRAGARRVAWVDQGHLDVVGKGLVEDKLVQLRKRPPALLRPFRLRNGDPVAYPPEVFEGNAASGALGCGDQCVGDPMVFDPSKTGLLARDVLEGTPGVARAARLQLLPQVVVFEPHPLDVGAAVVVPVGVGGQVDDALVDAEEALGGPGVALVERARQVEVELAVAQGEVGLAQALGVEQQRALLTGDKEGHLDALASGASDGDQALVSEEREEAWVEGEGAVGSEDRARERGLGGSGGRSQAERLGLGDEAGVASPLASVALGEVGLEGGEGVGDLRLDADGLLRLQGEALAQFAVEAMVQGELAKDAEGEGLLCEPGAGLVEPSQQGRKTSEQGRVEAELDGDGDDHKARLPSEINGARGKRSAGRQEMTEPEGSLLPSVNEGGFRLLAREIERFF